MVLQVKVRPDDRILNNPVVQQVHSSYNRIRWVIWSRQCLTQIKQMWDVRVRKDVYRSRLLSGCWWWRRQSLWICPVLTTYPAGKNRVVYHGLEDAGDRRIVRGSNATLYLQSVGSLQWIFPPADGDKYWGDDSNCNVNEAVWALSVHVRWDTDVVVEPQEAVACGLEEGAALTNMVK